MSKKKHNRPTSDEFKAEEPSVEFTAVRIFKSAEEMEEDELKWLSSNSPEEHLHHAVSLIKRVYAEELKNNPKIGSEIKFGRSE